MLNLLFDFLYRVDVGNVADVLKVHAASIFRIEVCRIGVCIYIDFDLTHRRIGGGDA
jgi:hypothetical protein